jgi:two-component system OmpR family response regulator
MSGSRLCVLIVEDLKDTADSTAELLTLFGHGVRVAPCGADALRQSAAATPDVILLDIGLPGMCGWEVAMRVRRQIIGKQPLIVAVTGRGTECDRWNSALAGIDMHLIKPVEPATLSRLMTWVGECLDRVDHSHFEGLARVCAWCQKVFTNGAWRAGEPRNYVAVTHGMCPSCFETAMLQIK